ncbi:ankyrin repeat domain-containing protein [Sphingopyxis yananensis]|uniref:ankyrin repeat domain-containing protein n=1 Tax=Sphingopyxis yananensis TaxID=2886687 RepID=UPI002A598E1E|nr:ankyrin repeat domain-containing protein [Sphingopyxis yananensis]
MMFLKFRYALWAIALATAVTTLAPSSAQAQFRGGYAFLKAVESRDGTKATEALQNDSTLINSRHPDNGETALAIATKRRDLTWVRFLLGKGADPAIADRQGVTPLMHAALLNFTDGATELLGSKAPVDQSNRRGETALILAVQARNTALVSLLVRNGANPDKSDHVAGLSARGYAQRDDRTGSILSALDAKSDVAVRDGSAVFGPQ